jgi:hypothetical protein
MPWHKISLTLVQAEKGAGDQILNELDDIFITSEYPKNAAVFNQIDLQNRLCNYYFSPEAVNICSGVLSRWGGIECQEPGPGAIRLIGRPEYTRG